MGGVTAEGLSCAQHWKVTEVTSGEGSVLEPADGQQRTLQGPVSTSAFSGNEERRPSSRQGASESSQWPSRHPGPHKESWRLAQHAPTACRAQGPPFSGARSWQGKQGCVLGCENSRFRGAGHESPPGTKDGRNPFLNNSILLTVINIFHLSPIYSCKIVYDIHYLHPPFSIFLETA